MERIRKTNIAEESVRGLVTKIIDGDVFEMKVLSVLSANPDQYDTVERVHIDTLSVEQEPADIMNEPEETPEQREAESVSEESGGRDEGEVEQEAGWANYSRFYTVRHKEDLEARVLNREVRCIVKVRNALGELVADVEVV